MKQCTSKYIKEIFPHLIDTIKSITDSTIVGSQCYLRKTKAGKISRFKKVMLKRESYLCEFSRTLVLENSQILYISVTTFSSILFIFNSNSS